ncbi:MAG: hypothetical protein WAW37_04580, partial [Syntrophobacteraceae bacterium]
FLQVTCSCAPTGLNNSAQGQSRASRDATLGWNMKPFQGWATGACKFLTDTAALEPVKLPYKIRIAARVAAKAVFGKKPVIRQ